MSPDFGGSLTRKLHLQDDAAWLAERGEVPIPSPEEQLKGRYSHFGYGARGNGQS